MQHLRQFDQHDGLSAAMAAHPAAASTSARQPAARPPADARVVALRSGVGVSEHRGVGGADGQRPGARPPGRAVTTAAPREDGSLVTEYGLLAVVAATVAGVVIQWASGGALVTLFNALLRHARSLVGA
jgi:hypothetical protein